MKESESMDLSKLTEPFPADDIEWRVSRAGKDRNGQTYCKVLAYITARAIQSRLDEICGPENWQLTEPQLMTHDRRSAIGVGITILANDRWITKWDVAELTDGGQHIPPFKGGFSGAMKRAGAQWGIGRYLYHLSETSAETSERSGEGWNWAKLSQQHGGGIYYWKPPTLPAWALPKDEHKIRQEDLNELKLLWKNKFSESNDPAELREGFHRFVSSVVGDFPISDHTCWTAAAWDKCRKRIDEFDKTVGGVLTDVPFQE